MNPLENRPLSGSLRPLARPAGLVPSQSQQPERVAVATPARANALTRDTNQVQAQPTAAMEPTSFQMPSQIDEIYQAIKNYPESRATDSEAREIAREIFRSSREMGVDYKLLTAIMAHESKFDPQAKSSTGARGLGQLTGVAINELKRLAKSGREPYSSHLATFERIGQRSANRTNIRDNIETMAGYVRLMQDRSGSTNRRLLQNYNGEPGRRESYPRQVQGDYQTLWGQPMPARRVAAE